MRTRGPRNGSRALAAVSFLLVAAVLSAPAAAGTGGRGFAGSSGEAGPSGPPSPSAQPAGALPGIDVSHYQGTIDWAQVAGAGTRFVFAKATEGRTYVDPMFAANKLGAEAYGLAFGAYHFAQPDRGADDAIIEADHFVDTAQLVPGELVPVLDIERTNGLTQAQITSWILAWLGRVTERLGVRPMVYTSPAGWESRTGDTTAIVDAGYTLLWIAHWNVDEPRLPANDWGGNGWTFWQYGDCGTVPGIAGCVDVDWYRESSFDPVEIPSPDVVPPIASISAPADVDQPATVSFSEIVHRVVPADVLVRAASTGSAVDASLTCRSGKGVEVDCETGNVRTVTVQPLAPLLLGESYEADVNPAGATVLVVDRSGNPAAPTAQPFAAPTEVEQDGPAVTASWRTVANREAFGDSYALEHVAGASASFAFSGRWVTWDTVAGPAQGRASVWIDGRRVGAVDDYAPATAFRVSHTFTGLERGPHVITIRVLGVGSPAATDTQVAVDAFETAAGRVANPAIETTWGTLEASRASGGSVSESDLARASVELAFRGTGITWYTVRGPDQGRASIFVDGALVRTVDDYAAQRAFGVARTVTGLADGAHTLRIVVLGQARPAARAALVSIDRFVVAA